MEEQIHAFLDFLASEKKYSENTIAAYRNDLTQFLGYLQRRFGVQRDPEEKDAMMPITWSDIGREVIVSYIMELREREYTSSTIARKVAALKSFFHYLVAADVISSDPTVTLDSPKVKKRLPKAISRRDIERLLAAPTGSDSPKARRDHALLELLYASGMRVTELVSLNVDDIDLQAGTVFVHGKKALSKERVISIGETATQAVASYLQHGRAQLAHDPSEKALFLNHRGQRLTRQGLWLIIKHYVEQVGISQDVTPHTLRHSFAAHKLSQGKSLQDIQRLLGHANISTTQVYQQVSQESEL
jgi:integrase/recombinase XerD